MSFYLKYLLIYYVYLITCISYISYSRRRGSNTKAIPAASSVQTEKKVTLDNSYKNIDK